MNHQQEKPNVPLDRLSFFGVPAGGLWAHVGGRFWGGVLAGLGVGLLSAKVLAELEIPTVGWLRLVAVLLAAIGPIIALQSVRRSLQSGDGPAAEPVTRVPAHNGDLR